MAAQDDQSFRRLGADRTSLDWATPPSEPTRPVPPRQQIPIPRNGRYKRPFNDEDAAHVLPALDLASLLSYTMGPDGANTQQRRRAQNRASQRAFRERKRTHTEGLEAELDKLHELHQDLLNSYKRKADEVDVLSAHVEELNIEITSLQSTSELFPASGSDSSPTVKFDNTVEWNIDYSEPNPSSSWYPAYFDSPYMPQKTYAEACGE